MTESALRIADKPIENPFGRYTQSSTAQGAQGKTKAEMLEKFKQVRQESIHIFGTFSEKELIKMGIHEWFPASPRSLVLCISGHQQHHFKVIQDKYL